MKLFPILYPYIPWDSGLYQAFQQLILLQILLQKMGGSESSIDSYVKQHGTQSLFRLVLLKNKMNWLQEDCSRQINRKIDDEIKYILFQMDQFVNQKKQSALHQYKKAKSQILLKQSYTAKKYQEKHHRSLENIYGKNNFLDKLNLLKIDFHIQVHITKKRVKKKIGQKLTSIENQTFLKLTDRYISKGEFEALFKGCKDFSQLTLQNKQIHDRLEEFKQLVTAQLNFESLFWPHFDPQMRQKQQEVAKIYSEVQKNTKSMKKDLQGNWNPFKFQST